MFLLTCLIVDNDTLTYKHENDKIRSTHFERDVAELYGLVTVAVKYVASY